jgi:hypothetical protein
MTRDSRKRVGVLFLVGAVLVPLAIVSTAWACGRLANLRLSADSARAGQEVTGVGLNYNSQPTSSDVTVRLGGRSGPVLWQGRTNAQGTIAPVFTVPRVKSGYYTIVATQYLASGAPAAGTPGRDVLRIGRVKRQKTSSGTVAPWASPAPPTSGAGPAGGAPAHTARAIDVSTPVVVGGTLLFVVLAASGVTMLRSARRTRTA